MVLEGSEGWKLRWEVRVDKLKDALRAGKVSQTVLTHIAKGYTRGEGVTQQWFGSLGDEGLPPCPADIRRWARFSAGPK